MKKLPITKEDFEKSRYFQKKYGKRIGQKKRMCVEKRLSQLTGDMYEFYQWLKSKCSGVVGVDVTYGKTHRDGSEDVSMTFQLQYQWENEMDKKKDSGIHRISAIMEYIAKKFGWGIDIKWFNSYRAATDDVLTIKLINRKENLTTEVKSKMKKLPITKETFEMSRYFLKKYGKLEYVNESGKVFKTSKGKILKFKEGTESNPRFKCMEGYDYSDDIREFREDIINVLKEYYGGEYYVEPGMDGKSILVTDGYAGIDYKIDISVSTEVDQQGNVLKFVKESCDEEFDRYYERMKKIFRYDSGIHIRLRDNEDGSETIEVTFDDRFDWNDDVVSGRIPLDEDSGLLDWITRLDEAGHKYGWEFDFDIAKDIESPIDGGANNDYLAMLTLTCKCDKDKVSESINLSGVKMEPMDDGTQVLTRRCPSCGNTHSITVQKKDFFDGMRKLKNGERMQNAFPTWTPNEREFLMTGICDKCW